MTSEQDWAKDGGDFNPDEMTQGLLIEIDSCLSARNPNKYLSRKYPSPDNLSFSERLSTCVCLSSIMVASAIGMDKLIDGLSTAIHFIP